MKFVEVERLPDKTYSRYAGYCAIQDLCLEFLNSGFKIARVDYGEEYSSANNARSSFCLACKTLGLPIKAVMRNDQVYLMRTDM